MSGDHNMNQTDSGWRKRQIALDKKAENARELGLDYEPDKTVIEMAYEAGFVFGMTEPVIMVRYIPQDGFERFAALIRADERNSWPAEMEAMERQVNILTDALAKAKADEREIYSHDIKVLMNALWKSCGDDKEVVQATIESQGTLIRGQA
jgi:hypothetical protein